MNKKIEACICLQCGAMSWLMVSNRYVGEYYVREDGHVEFEESFDELEYLCNECGGHSSLLHVKGTAKIYRELVRLNPMKRILKALNYIIDGVLELDEDVSTEEIMDLLECFKDRWTMKHRGKRHLEAVEDFMARAAEVLGKWKLLEL